MKRHSILAVATLAAVAAGPASRPATRGVHVERESFALTAVPPPTPALRYAFVVDPSAREAGNAAALYYQAALLAGANGDDINDHARTDHPDDRGLAADPLVRAAMEKSGPVFDLLAVAARRSQCDWGVPLHDLGWRALLPQLNHLRGLANLLRVRGLERADAGDVDGAVAAIREQYAMGRHTAQDLPLVGGLVGVGITSVADNMVRGLMNRPDGPNLYWSLATLPRPVVGLRATMENERQWLVAQFPVAAKGREGGVTAADWPALLRELDDWRALSAGPAAKADPGEGDPGATDPRQWPAWPRAAAYYGRTRTRSAEAVAKVDAGQVLATYLVEQFQAANDERQALLSLPYPLLLPRWEQLPARMKEIGIDADNPLLTGMAAFARVPRIFAVADRELAAMTAVEALRSYAAGHGGRLPARLAEVAETPVPENPVTGQPFEYRLDGDVATLGDHGPLLADRPLEYTVRIRKP